MMTFNTKAKKSTILLALVVVTFSFTSCDYLNVVPDNVSTIDKAFTLRNEAQKYLFTLYSFLPKNGDQNFNVGMLTGDEEWTPFKGRRQNYGSGTYIAHGSQNKSAPYLDFWNSSNGAGTDLFQGIRQCNIFLENLRDRSKVRDIEEGERVRWIGEAMFLKAYFHYYLMRMYGPIPIIDKNVPVDAPEKQVQQKRQPVDKVVDYVVTLLDSASVKLPSSIIDKTTEYGRITATIAKSVKSEVLLTAASPLFNGNTDYPNFTNDEGTPYINPDYDPAKWDSAAAAALDAIQAAEAAGHALYKFPATTSYDLTDTTTTKLSIRQALCEREDNPEVIWPLTNSPASKRSLQFFVMPALARASNLQGNQNRGSINAPLKIAEMFYTKNGVPINEDKTLDFSDIAKVDTAGADHKYNIEEGFATAHLNFNREPRFYADLGFDGSTWYKRDSPSKSDENTFYVESKYGDPAGAQSTTYPGVTGYFIKKVVDWRMVFASNSPQYRSYPWPQIRLPELYLNYAEAENEANGPSAKIYKYLDKIRERAGLKGVVQSWQDYSTNPKKPTTQDGLREIIHRERNIELAFEGKRFWDLRRWKTANKELNEDIKGWNVFGDDTESYNQVLTVYQRQFIAPRDYLWPIQENTIIQNPALKQNPGW